MARMIIVNAYVLFGIVKIYFLQFSGAKSNNIYIYIYIENENANNSSLAVHFQLNRTSQTILEEVAKNIAFKSLARSGWLSPLRTPINAPTLQNIM